jgi:hypothetical protein
MEFWNKLTVGGLAGWAVMLILILMSLIQISPIRLNPWDRVFSWLGKKMNGQMQKQLDELRKQVSDLWINSHRQSILTFARECRDEIKHDSEEWAHILSLADEYEIYCQKNTVSNGVVKADTEYIRNLYQELSRDHRI